jgi:predicted SAM-dependent methyltransferase
MQSEKLIRANIGCGNDYRQGWLNVDRENVRADVIHDLNVVPWPIETNSCSEVFMQGVLEHLPNTVATMEEVWRILVPNGLFRGSFPYWASTFAFRDPTHVRFFDEKIFDYWTHEVPWASSKARFAVKRVELCNYNDKLVHKLRNAIPFRRLLRWFLINMYDLVEFEITAVK